jgi:magnesium chelatase family protein
MTLARTYSVALVGVEGHVIEVEADIANGLPATVLVGLPDTALREARDRVRAAILNSGRDWPKQKITIGLSPANLPKRGSGFDLAIAIALLAADGAVPLTAPKDMVFLAELGLDGQLRPVPGVLPAVVAAVARGMETMVVAAENKAEAELVPGVRVVGASSLIQVMDWLRGGPFPYVPVRPLPGPSGSDGAAAPGRHQPDLSEVLGQADARMALEICAAGGHNLSLLGPPGAGKTMLAERLPTILPELDTQAALEVTSIHSVAGKLPTGAGLITTPPFRGPHHTATKAAIVGGGSGTIQPGAASLAHRGVLFLDEAPEFNRDVLDALRQPLEAGEVTIARSGMYATFPARFTLVLASNPCPCAKADSGGAGCSCSPTTRRRYLARLSGPLLDRIDVKVKFESVTREALLFDRKFAETSEVVGKRVAAAREHAAGRLRGTPWRLNAEIPGAQLRRDFAPKPGALRELDRVMELGQVSARGADKIVRVAWSVADLEGVPRPGADQIHTAIGLWLGVAR